MRIDATALLKNLGPMGLVLLALWTGQEKMDARLQATATAVTELRGEVRELRAELTAERRQNERLAGDLESLREQCAPEVKP